MIYRVHVDHGVIFHLGQKPRELREGAVILESGERVPARFAVAGISTVRQIGGRQRASETFSCRHWFTLSFSVPADATKSAMAAASDSADG